MAVAFFVQFYAEGKQEVWLTHKIVHLSIAACWVVKFGEAFNFQVRKDMGASSYKLYDKSIFIQWKNFLKIIKNLTIRINVSKIA